VAELATQSGAIAAINAGFFDPQNGLTTSHVMIAGQPAADPRQNPRLIENPNLTDYLPQILGRSELRIYLCRGIQRLAIAPHTDPVLAGCQLRDAVGAGPRLLPEITAEAEAFLGPGRDALGFNQPNARSAVGIKANGDLIWVMAAQIPGRSRGLSLPELAALLRHQGAEQGLNLDGGSSSSLYYQGHTHPGRVNAQGEPVSRAIKSALVLQGELIKLEEKLTLLLGFSTN
jgi:hypothetical protein